MHDRSRIPWDNAAPQPSTCMRRSKKKQPDHPHAATWRTKGLKGEFPIEVPAHLFGLKSRSGKTITIRDATGFKAFLRALEEDLAPRFCNSTSRSTSAGETKRGEALVDLLRAPNLRPGKYSSTDHLCSTVKQTARLRGIDELRHVTQLSRGQAAGRVRTSTDAVRAAGERLQAPSPDSVDKQLRVQRAIARARLEWPSHDFAILKAFVQRQSRTLTMSKHGISKNQYYRIRDRFLAMIED